MCPKDAGIAAPTATSPWQPRPWEAQHTRSAAFVNSLGAFASFRTEGIPPHVAPTAFPRHTFRFAQSHSVEMNNENQARRIENQGKRAGDGVGGARERRFEYVSGALAARARLLDGARCVAGAGVVDRVGEGEEAGLQVGDGVDPEDEGEQLSGRTAPGE